MLNQDLRMRILTNNDVAINHSMLNLVQNKNNEIDLVKKELEYAISFLKGKCEACYYYQEGKGCIPNSELSTKSFCCIGEEWRWRGIKR